MNKRDNKFCVWGVCILVGENRQETKQISKKIHIYIHVYVYICMCVHTHTDTIRQQDEFSMNKNSPRKVSMMPVKGQQGGCPAAKLDSS